MRLKRYIAMLMTTVILAISSQTAFAAESAGAEENRISLILESESLDGKVNDPVTKRTMKAKIFNENPEFRIETSTSALNEVDIIVYSNEYVEGQDRGIRNRIMKKRVTVGESFQLLPDEIYETAEEDGSLYDFVNRCFVMRIFTDQAGQNYVDNYFGIVEDNIYGQMYDAQQEKAEADKAKTAKLGPAAKM